MQQPQCMHSTCNHTIKSFIPADSQVAIPGPDSGQCDHHERLHIWVQGLWEEGEQNHLHWGQSSVWPSAGIHVRFSCFFSLPSPLLLSFPFFSPLPLTLSPLTSLFRLSYCPSLSLPFYLHGHVHISTDPTQRRKVEVLHSQFRQFPFSRRTKRRRSSLHHHWTAGNIIMSPDLVT